MSEFTKQTVLCDKTTFADEMITVAIALGVLVSAVLLIVFGLHICAYGGILWDSIRLRTRLEKRGRAISLDEAKERIKKGEGLIIIEAPTLGWNVSRVWWSPSTDLASRSSGTKEDELVSPEDGTIMIDSSTNRQELLGWSLGSYGLSASTPF